MYRMGENISNYIQYISQLLYPFVCWWMLRLLPAAAKSLQSCPTLCDPIDGSPPGPPVPGILQARTLEWVAISFSNAWKWKVKVRSLSHVRLLATPWTAAYQAPTSMGFSRQEYWSGVPLPSLRLLPCFSYCKSYCYEHWNACMFSFSSDIYPDFLILEKTREVIRCQAGQWGQERQQRGMSGQEWWQEHLQNSEMSQ